MKIMQKDRLNERVGSGLMMQMNKFIDLMKEADGKALLSIVTSAVPLFVVGRKSSLTRQG